MQSLSEFPFYYTNISPICYNVRMINNFRDRLSINVTLSITVPMREKNFFNPKRRETLGELWGNAG